MPDPRRVPMPAGSGAAAPRRPSAEPPPRPRTASDLPPPLPEHRRRPPTLSPVATWTWTASVLAGLIALAAGYADRAALREHLTDSARAADPGRAADLLRDGVTVTMLLVGTVGALLVLAVVACLLAGRQGRRHASLLLGVVGLVLLGVLAFAQAFVAGGAEVDRIALLAQAGLVVLGLVSLRAGRG